MICDKRVLENIVIFTGKHFLTKFQTFRLATLLESDSMKFTPHLLHILCVGNILMNVFRDKNLLHIFLTKLT